MLTQHLQIMPQNFWNFFAVYCCVNELSKLYFITLKRCVAGYHRSQALVLCRVSVWYSILTLKKSSFAQSHSHIVLQICFDEEVKNHHFSTENCSNSLIWCSVLRSSSCGGLMSECCWRITMNISWGGTKPWTALSDNKADETGKSSLEWWSQCSSLLIITADTCETWQCDMMVSWHSLSDLAALISTHQYQCR